MGEVEDDEVLRAASAASFDAFYLREFSPMVALASALCGDVSVGEELAQEAMVRACRRWAQVQRYDKPGAWLRRVTLNLASSARARRRAEAIALSRWHGRQRLVAAPTPEPDFWDLLRVLPRRQRAAVALHYLEDRSIDDIASVLECRPNTVKAHLHQARQRLARELGAAEA